MGKHIIVAGNYAAGKTTLAKAICERTGYVPFWEEPEKRPFQTLFTTDLVRWSLANEIDFFTFRVRQELAIKQHAATCIQDGSLEQDMFVFARHLFNRGVLQPLEYELCKEVCATYRALLAPPDLIVKVNNSIATIVERRAVRARASDEKLVKQSEIENLELLVHDWIASIRDIPILEFDADDENFPQPERLEDLIKQIETHLAK
jgi:deoxyadenosine/deoxycytidine kinase